MNRGRTIAFDARMALHSGIGTHIRGLVGAFAEMREEGLQIPEFIFTGSPEILGGISSFGAIGKIQPSEIQIYSLREQLAFPVSAKVEAFHFPHYNVPQFISQPYVVTIQDLIHWLFPAQMGSRIKAAASRFLIRRAVSRARIIFTASEWSRRDLIRELGVREDRIRITPNAVDKSFVPMRPSEVETVQRELALPARYLLAVGIHKPHKNFEFLIKTFLDWRTKQKEDLSLVICGLRSGEKQALQEFASGIGNAASIHLLDYLDHSRLPAIYQAAEALVFPSLYEGFGIPVLEAQRIGTPVICTNASSVPEVAGNAALFFDPRSPGELSSCLTRLYTHAELRNRLIVEGRENEKRFTWKDAAKTVLQVYAEL